MAKKEFVTLKEACEWASSYLRREVTQSNISYLIQYGKIRRYDENGDLRTTSGGVTKVSLSELRRYYHRIRKEETWKERLGENINWDLSFDNVRESERTKHVHRLHPYKGKFIPQLVEYFLDGHTNNFKKTVFFHKGDTVLDPFAGSGTTLVQCLELGLHSIGVDISRFNCLITRVKVQKYDLSKLSKELRKAAKATERFSEARFGPGRNENIDKLLSFFNNKYYPNIEFKILLRRIRAFQSKLVKEINRSSKHMSEYENSDDITRNVLSLHRNEKVALEKQIENFLDRNHVPLEFVVEPSNLGNLVNEFTRKYEEITLKALNSEIESAIHTRQAKLNILPTEEKSAYEPFTDSAFLSDWFQKRQKMEMQHYLNQIHQQENPKIQSAMKIILSRTARSCRATKHVDLATLIKPQLKPYYCRKHFKICRPVTTVIRHLTRYTEDTLKRIRLFSKLRKNVFCEVINADSRTVDIFDCLAEKNEEFHKMLRRNGIDGIFTSPPYVGQIDYHEQHAYAYDLFNIERKDELEIGRMSNGVSQRAQKEYVIGISKVLENVTKYLKKDAHLFIVANDIRNLYPKIAETSGLEIIEIFKRPVLNRTERDKQPYSESIFHMRLE